MNDIEIIPKPYPFVPGANQIVSTYGTDDRDGVHYLMWSGGCDSSLLLLELLKAYSPDKIVAISYNYPWLFDKKRDSERNYRSAFKTKLKTIDATYEKLTHIEIDVSMKTLSGNDRPMNYRGLPQAVSWLLSLPMFVSDNSYVYSGAVHQDDLTLHLDSYHRMFKGLAETLDLKLQLREPYLYFSKAQIIDKLFQYKIYDETWFCEIPIEVGVPCYECIPCRAHIAALIELSLGNDGDLLTMLAKRELDNITKIRHDRRSSQKKVPNVQL